MMRAVSSRFVLAPYIGWSSFSTGEMAMTKDEVWSLANHWAAIMIWTRSCLTMRMRRV
jgi:hypothetical protein